MKKITLLILGIALVISSQAQNYLLYKGGPNFTLPNQGPREHTCINSGPRNTRYGSEYTQKYYKNTLTGEYFLDAYTISSSSVTNYVLKTGTKLERSNISYTQCGARTPVYTYYNDDAGGINISVVDFKFTTSKLTVCYNAGTIDLRNYFTYNTNTIFTGNGVTGYYFNPNEAGVSSEDGWTITASNGTFNNSNSTTIYSTFKIRVTPSYNEQGYGDMWLIEDLKLCEDQATVNLLDHVRFKTGTFAWNGGSGSAFTASSVGVGDHTITYTYENGHNCTTEHDLQVRIDPTFTVNAGDDEAFCLEDSPELLFSSNNEYWEGAGISDNVFTPSEAGVGSHTITLHKTQGACSKKDNKTFTVLALPPVDAGGDLQFCLENGLKELNTSRVAPATGTWSFVTNSVFNNFIDNSAKTLDITNLPVAEYDLLYQYTDNNGCYNEDTRKVKINDVLTAPFIHGDAFNCGPGKITMQILEPQLNVTYNWYEAENEVSPFFTNNSFTTETLSETKEFWVSAINTSGCESPKRKVFAEIREFPTINAGPVQYVCFEGDSIELTGGIPNGGVYSGTNVANNYFNPKNLPSGNYNITYSADQNGCPGSGTKRVVIREKAVIDAGPNKQACFGSGIVELNDLNVFPSDGTWRFINENLSGALEGSKVDVNLLEPSPFSYLIEYSVTDSLGCKTSDVKGLTIYPQPETPQVSFRESCGASSLTFSVANLNTLNTYNWYKDTISTAPFRIGQTFSSEYLNESKTYYVQAKSPNNCLSPKVSFDAIIKPEPQLEFPEDILVCLNAPTIGLDTLVSPIGGSFSGNGISGNKFYPIIAGEGDHLVEYYYTNEFGCSKTEGFLIKVAGSLNDNLIGADTSFCKSEPTINLRTWTGIQGGTFSGLGVENNYFTPSASPNDALAINFEYEADGCVYRDSREITLLSSPETPEIQGNNEGCIGDILEFSTTRVTNLSYNWYLDEDVEVFSTDQNINIKIGDVETVSLETVNQVGCPSFGRAIVQVLNKNPTGTISASKTEIEVGDYTKFTFNGINANSIRWDFGDNDYSLETSPYHYYYDRDTFDISAIVTSSLGCIDTISRQEYIIVTGEDIEIPLDAGQSPINGLVKNLDLLVYPNPSNDQVNILFGESGTYQIQMLDLRGEILQSETLKGKELEIKVADLSAGIYLLQISGDLTKTLKIQKL